MGKTMVAKLKTSNLNGCVRHGKIWVRLTPLCPPPNTIHSPFSNS